MSGQRAALVFPAVPPNVTVVTYSEILEKIVHPKGTRCLTVSVDKHGQLVVVGITTLPAPRRAQTFLLDARIPADGRSRASFITVPIECGHANIYLSLMAFLFNSRNRSTGEVDPKFNSPSAFPPTMVVDFFVFYFELFGLVRDDSFRTSLVSLLVGFSNEKVTDRLGILQGSATDISARTLVMRHALERGLTYGHALKILFAMQASVDPDSARFSGASAWPLAEVPSPHTQWTPKAANEYLRRLLLGAGAAAAAPLRTASELHHSGHSGEGGNGGANAAEAGALTINEGLIPFFVGPVTKSLGGTALAFKNMPLIPSVDSDIAELRLCTDPDGAAAVVLRGGRVVKTIGALSLASDGTFVMGVKCATHSVTGVNFTAHPILRAPDGRATAQLLQNPLQIASGEKFRPADATRGKTGFHNAVGMLINVSCSGVDAPILPRMAFTLAAVAAGAAGAADAARGAELQRAAAVAKNAAEKAAIEQQRQQRQQRQQQQRAAAVAKNAAEKAAIEQQRQQQQRAAEEAKKAAEKAAIELQRQQQQRAAEEAKNAAEKAAIELQRAAEEAKNAAEKAAIELQLRRRAAANLHQAIGVVACAPPPPQLQLGPCFCGVLPVAAKNKKGGGGGGNTPDAATVNVNAPAAGSIEYTGLHSVKFLADIGPQHRHDCKVTRVVCALTLRTSTEFRLTGSADNVLFALHPVVKLPNERHAVDFQKRPVIVGAGQWVRVQRADAKCWAAPDVAGVVIVARVVVHTAGAPAGDIGSVTVEVLH